MLLAVLNQISKVAGQKGRVSSVYLETPDKYSNTLAYAQKRVQENKNSKRTEYNIINHSCVHFAMDVAAAGGIKNKSSILDARPISYVSSLQSEHPDVEFVNGKLTVEGW